MPLETQTLLNNIDIAKLVIENEFNISDEARSGGQLDLFASDILELRIQRIGVKLLKLTGDVQFVAGVAALLCHQYLPQDEYSAEDIAGFS